MVQKDFSLNDRVEAFFLAMAQSWETLIATFVLTIFCVILFLLETLYVVWKFDEASFVNFESIVGQLSGQRKSPESTLLF